MPKRRAGLAVRVRVSPPVFQAVHEHESSHVFRDPDIVAGCGG